MGLRPLNPYIILVCQSSIPYAWLDFECVHLDIGSIATSKPCDAMMLDLHWTSCSRQKPLINETSWRLVVFVDVD